MKTKTTVIWLAAALLLQMFVLSGMVAKAALPLWSGQEIRVKTLPIDPRSLFRGNYARLQYDFSRLPEDAFAQQQTLRQGEIIYARLRKGEDDLYVFDGASLEKPQSGIFVRGRNQGRYAPYRVNYGVEAFFAPKKQALKLEKELLNSGVAVLMIDSSGKAAIKEIVSAEHSKGNFD